MNIDVYTVCRNEMILAPFFIDYWRALADNVNVYVYDQMSDDGTREFLSKYDFVHIIDRNKNGLDDSEHLVIKNTCWRNSSADFVMVSDFDETIFSYDVDTLRNEFKKMKDEGYSVLSPLSFNIVGDGVPEYKEGKYLHEILRYGYNDPVYYTKMILFDPKKIRSINYSIGCHTANPVGDVKIYYPDDMFLIHAKFIGLDYYVDRIIGRKLSVWNTSMGFNAEKDKTIRELENTYNEHYKERFDWFDIRENFDIYYKTKQDWSIWGGVKR